MELKAELSYWLRPVNKLFKDFRKQTINYKNHKKRRIFIDRGSDILFIAHLDTVLPPRLIKQTKDRVYATGLDDRLGCMVAYNLSLEFDVDLLLTDNEEIGKTTAFYHDCKDYKWIAEFDRAGSDVVTYDLDNEQFHNDLDDCFAIGIGSYSDICSLDTLACCVNIGIGYRKAHNKDSYVDISILKKQTEKFREFYAEHKDTKYTQRTWTQYNDYGYSYNGNGYDYDCDCDRCGDNNAEPIFEYFLCESCIEILVLELHI